MDKKIKIKIKEGGGGEREKHPPAFPVDPNSEASQMHQCSPPHSLLYKRFAFGPLYSSAVQQQAAAFSGLQEPPCQLC